MENNRLSYEDYVQLSKEFVSISDILRDDWKLIEFDKEFGTCISKEVFKEVLKSGKKLILKAEYIICYNVSYGVPMFSFNYWNEKGVLLTLDEVRKLSLIKINKGDFYTVITQQEHPVLFRPFFTIHPCHTGGLLSNCNESSPNIIVSFLSLIAPLLQLNLKLEYACPNLNVN